MFPSMSSLSEARTTWSVDSKKPSSQSLWGKHRNLLSKLAILVIYCTVGCVFYYYYEGWGIRTSLSFTVVTMSTVGYGYHHPTDDNSRLFTIFYLIFGVYFVFVWISSTLSKRLQEVAAYWQEVTEMDKIGSSINHRKRLMAWNLFAIFMTVLIGGLILMGLENWSFIEGFYFALETSTTVGYGDLDISNENTHVFIGFYIVFSTVLFGFALNNFQTLTAQEGQLEKLKTINLKRQDLFFLENLDQGKGITKEQFALALLVHLGTVDADRDIKPWFEKFAELDKANDGILRRDTLHAFSKRESAAAFQELSCRISESSPLNPLMFLFENQQQDGPPAVSFSKHQEREIPMRPSVRGSIQSGLMRNSMMGDQPHV